MSIMYQIHNINAKLDSRSAIKIGVSSAALIMLTGCMTVPQSHVDNWFEYVGVNTSGYTYEDETFSPKKIKALSTGEMHQAN